MIKQIVCFFSLLCCLLETNAAPINKEVTVSGKIGKYTYVDLGLSVMWATYNVGASKPTDKGNCYAWGETKPKASYTPQNYELTKDSCITFTKYVLKEYRGKVDSLVALTPADDAATANWGKGWRMPTKAEQDELRFCCNWEWTDNFNGSGVAGSIGTSKVNGNIIFLPAFRDPDVDYGYRGRYRSSTLEPNNMAAYSLNVNDIGWCDGERSLGQSVRAVSTSKKITPNESMTVSGKNGNYTYVDLGLSVKWATFNVGATKPSECGDYFAWGETQPKSSYEKTNYKWSKDSCRTYSKYVDYNKYGTKDGLTTLALSDDAAACNWKNGWRMPTIDELQELIDGCDWEWVYDFYGSGMAGRVGVSKKNGNTIFLPAAGCCDGAKHNDVGFAGCYSSSFISWHSDLACFLFFHDINYITSDVEFGKDNRYRYYGQSVRAVCK